MPECPGALQYAQMRDGRMIRLRFPGGKLTSSQLHCLAKLSQENGNGLIDLTNRANLQIRGLHSLSENQLSNLLQQEHILADALWADRLRNIMADPLNGKEDGGLIDSTEMVFKLDQLVQKTTDLQGLSPKFCFIIDNGSPLQIARQPHDLALIAFISKSGLIRFQLSIAGHTTDLTVSLNEAPQFLITIAVFINQYETDKKRASTLIQKIGLQDLTQTIKNLFPTSQYETTTPRPPQTKRPPIGITFQNVNELDLLHGTPLIPLELMSQLPCTYSLGLGVPVSRLTAQQMITLSELCRYGDGYIRLSPWQIIYITDISEININKTAKIAEEAGFVTSPAFLDYQVYACSGRSGCPRTEMPCKEQGLALIKTFISRKLRHDTKTEEITLKEVSISKDNMSFSFDEADHSSEQKTVKIHLSGCIRGCGYAKEADILALAETDGSGYRLYNSKAVSEIRDQPSQKQPLHTNIVEEIMNRLNNSDKV